MKGFKFLSFGFDLLPSTVFGYFINLILGLPGMKKIYIYYLKKNISNSHHQMSSQKGCNHPLSHLCGISWLEFVFLRRSLCLWNSRLLPRVDTAHLWCPRWFHFWYLFCPFFSVWEPVQLKTNSTDHVSVSTGISESIFNWFYKYISGQIWYFFDKYIFGQILKICFSSSFISTSKSLLFDSGNHIWYIWIRKLVGTGFFDIM